MTARALIVAAALVASSLGVMPASAAAGAQAQGQLPNGGSYTLDRDPQIAAAAICVWFRVPSDGYDGATPGIARVAATAAAAATLASGRSFAEIVRQSGGQLSIEVYSDIVGINALVPSTAARRVVAAMTAAYFTPAIDATALSTAQRDAAVQSIAQRYSTGNILHNALFAQIFSSGPAHTAPTPDAPNVFTSIKLAAVQQFAHRAFAASNAHVALVGNVDASSLSAFAVSATTGSASAPLDSTLSDSRSSSTTIPASVSGIGLAWVGPPIHDEEAATALDFVSDYLFRDGTGVVAKSVGAAGETYVNGQFITLHNPGVMLVTIGGTHPGAAVPRVISALKALTQPLDATIFSAARNAFLYHLAVDTQTPSAQADNLGWYAAEGDASYAPGNANGRYIATARALTPQFVASVVKKYLQQAVIVRLTPGSAKESST